MPMWVTIAHIVSPVRVRRISPRPQLFLFSFYNRVQEGGFFWFLLPTQDILIEVLVRCVVQLRLQAFIVFETRLHIVSDRYSACISCSSQIFSRRLVALTGCQSCHEILLIQILGITNEHHWVFILVLFSWTLVVSLASLAISEEWSHCTLLEVTPTASQWFHLCCTLTPSEALVGICDTLSIPPLRHLVLRLVTEVENFRTLRISICSTIALTPLSYHLIHLHVENRIMSTMACRNAPLATHAPHVKTSRRCRSIYSDTWR